MKHLPILLLTIFLFALSAPAQVNWSSNGNHLEQEEGTVGTTNDKAISIQTNGNPRLHISPAGEICLPDFQGSGTRALLVNPSGKLLRETDPAAGGSCGTFLWDGDGNAISLDCFIGTTNNMPLRMKTNNLNRMVIENSGEVGVACYQATAPFQVFDNQPFALSQSTSGTRITSIGFNSYYSNGTPTRITSGHTARIDYWDISGALYFLMGDSGSAGSPTPPIYAMTLGKDGKVGIGHGDPQTELHVFNPIGKAALRIQSGVGSPAPQIEFHQGNITSNNASELGTIQMSSLTGGMAAFSIRGRDVAGVQSDLFAMNAVEATIHPRLGLGRPPSTSEQLAVEGGLLISQQNQAVRIGHSNGKGFIEATGSSNLLRINGTGDTTEIGGDLLVGNHIAIGSNSFADSGRDFKLSVNGHIRGKSMKVYPSWADYVFSKDYSLMPLSEVKAFIQENGHLPNVPSAATVQREGVDLGESQAMLLAKIEELTLHLINLEEENDALQVRIEQLENDSHD